MVLECIDFFESLLYNIVQLRVAQYTDKGYLTLKLKVVAKRYWESGMMVELLGMIPLTIIFSNSFVFSINFLAIFDVKEPEVLISLLMLNRLLLLRRLPHIQNVITSEYPDFMKFLTVFNPLALLFFIWHMSSTMWMWFNLVIEGDREITWLKFLELGQFNIVTQYAYCLHFTMNIATTTGFSEQIVYNNGERLVYILLTYVGNALFALAFGLMAANTSTLPEKFVSVYDTITRLERMFGKDGVPKKIKQRVENYYTHVVNSNSANTSEFRDYKGLIPDVLFKEIMFEKSDVVRSYPLFKDIKSKLFMIQILEGAEERVYMTDDYVVYKVIIDFFFIH